MKKNILLLMAVLMSAISAGAVDWQAVETNIPNFNLYIDNDSLKSDDNGNYLYAVRYYYTGGKEKVAYIKSNSDNYIGVIQAGDFEAETYSPKAVFANVHVFMKPINDESFLTFSHKYVLNMSSGFSATTAKNEAPQPFVNDNYKKVSDYTKQESNIKPVKYKEVRFEEQMQTNSSNLKEYVSSVSELLNDNWQPPATGRKTQAVVIVTIGSDGSLYGYRFAKSSGDEATDRSIISALKQTVPFPKFPNMKKNTRSYNFQFVFDYGRFKKSVL